MLGTVSQSMLRRTQSHEMLSDRMVPWSRKFGRVYISAGP